MSYTRKTKTVYVIQEYYSGHGWEDVNEEDTWADGMRSLREYRENSQAPVRYRTRRVKIEAVQS